MALHRYKQTHTHTHTPKHTYTNTHCHFDIFACIQSFEQWVEREKDEPGLVTVYFEGSATEDAQHDGQDNQGHAQDYQEGARGDGVKIKPTER